MGLLDGFADFHTEPLATLWLVAAARDLFAGRRRAWIWIALLLLTGDVGASYCAALGLSAMITGQRWWRAGLAFACLGVAWIVLLGAIHATKGTVPSYYAPLILGHPGAVPDTATALTVAKAIVLHPGRAISAFWANHLNVWATLSAAGLLGIAWPPVFVPLVAVLVEGALTHGPQSSLPGFQNFPVLVLGAVGTLAICLRLTEGRMTRRRLLFPALLLALAVNGIAGPPPGCRIYPRPGCRSAPQRAQRCGPSPAESVLANRSSCSRGSPAASPTVASCT